MVLIVESDLFRNVIEKHVVNVISSSAAFSDYHLCVPGTSQLLGPYLCAHLSATGTVVGTYGCRLSLFNGH